LAKHPKKSRDPTQADAGTLSHQDSTDQILIAEPSAEPRSIVLSTLDRLGPWLKSFGKAVAIAAGIATITFGIVLSYNHIRDVYDDRITTESEARRLNIDGVRDEFRYDTKALESRLREVEQELIRIQTTLETE
jgi:hypothetical protein